MRHLLAVLLLSSCVPSRLGPPVGHRREVCDGPDGGRYMGVLRAGDALFLCRGAP